MADNKSLLGSALVGFASSEGASSDNKATPIGLELSSSSLAQVVNKAFEPSVSAAVEW